MKSTITYCLMILIGLSSVSCGDWLDVLPKSEVDEKEMFESADGYYSAITGVYISMADTSLYGGHIPVSLMEPLTQQYYTRLHDTYREEWAAHDYTNTQIEHILSGLWVKMYNSIVNCNLLLEHIRNENRDLFEDGVLPLMQGEALGLRACMYFDLVRMFNESVTQHSASNNVPFKTDFGLGVGEKLPTATLLQKIVADLEEAQGLLLNNDPVVSGKQYRDKYASYSRNQRMNYYAVTALLARIHLYMGDYTKAYTNAMTVINSKHYRFIREEEIVVTDTYGKELKIDRIFMPELIFGLYTENILTTSRKWLEGYTGDQARSLNCYVSGDIRINAWHVTNSIRGYNVIKYLRSTNPDEQYKYDDPIVPVLRLSEIYLIAAEAAVMQTSTGGDAVALLNVLKSNRNTPLLPETATENQIHTEITREYIGEFRAEGQLFWYYKRKDMTSIDNGNYQGTTVQIPSSAYTFPLPQYEIDYGTGNK